MNICILKESLCIGGTERSAANLSKVLSNNHNVFIALFDGKENAYSSRGQMVDFNLPPKSSLLGKVYNTVLRDVKLRRLIRKEHIDVLYSFTGVTNKLTHYKYRTVKIISARDFGAMESKYNEYKSALDNSDAMICNSEYTKRYYLSKYPQDASKVFSLYNFINFDEIHQQAVEEVENDYQSFINNHQKIIVSVGRFCREKGFEYLIAAFIKAREINKGLGLVLIGDGEYIYTYKNLIHESNVDNHVFFTGLKKNPYKYMNRCDCFVLSSISEGFPNVLAEAMALGLPVIADNCCSGPAEILRKDKDYNAVHEKYIECDYGILTPRILEKNNDMSISELAKAVVWMCDDEQRMKEYGKKSILGADQFSFVTTKDNIESIFDELKTRKDRQKK